MAVWKALPALAAGNAVVVKPSELTPLTTIALAEAVVEAGLPPGALNVLTGRGPDAGAHLVGHPGVDVVSFTGSTPVGTGIAATAAATAKRVHLELGGKAPFVVFDDADLEAAVHGAVAAALINSGQDCTAATRACVQRPRMRSVRLGPTPDPDTDQGPLISSAHRDKVAGMVERARRDGATVVVVGEAPGGALAAGSYYRPTLITGAPQRAEIVQEEVFAPVLVALPFDDDDEAVALANDSGFGLAASVWTRDVYRSLRATREIRAGAVWVNDHIPIISEMPHGGYKQSGYGKGLSQYALDDYTQIEHVMFDTTGLARKAWQTTIVGG